MPFARAEIGNTVPGPATESNPTGTLYVRYKGTFDYTYVYRELKRWFEQRRFRFYDTRLKDTNSAIKNDLEAERNLDEFVSERYAIKILAWALKQEEKMVDGQLRKMYAGHIQFEIKGSIKLDRADFFKKGGKFLRFLGNRFMDARWREIEMKYIDTMEYRSQDIQSLIKRTLNMTTQENAPW